MMKVMAEAKRTRFTQILTTLASLIAGDPRVLLALVKSAMRSVPWLDRHPGIYEVLEYEARLELKDIRGARVDYYKRQKVRFLQDHVITYQDMAWGDGDIFADYKCSPGVPVDRYREGHRHRVLISLRQTKNRGDTEEFHIHRVIRNGFTNSVEDFQTEIDHRTCRLDISVIFPRERPAKQATLIEQNASRTLALDADHIRILPDGRQRVSWRTRNPRRYEAYIVRWEW